MECEFFMKSSRKWKFQTRAIKVSNPILYIMSKDLTETKEINCIYIENCL